MHNGQKLKTTQMPRNSRIYQNRKIGAYSFTRILYTNEKKQIIRDFIPWKLGKAWPQRCHVQRKLGVTRGLKATY
jgi:hypothetical protein